MIIAERSYVRNVFIFILMIFNSRCGMRLATLTNFCTRNSQKKTFWIGFYANIDRALASTGETHQKYLCVYESRCSADWNEFNLGLNLKRFTLQSLSRKGSKIFKQVVSNLPVMLSEWDY